MKREEAIEILNNTAFFGRSQEDIDNAIDMAIEALKQEPCEDCISRQAAIRLAEQGQIQGFMWQIQKLIGLPPVQPKQKTGHWIESEYGNMITTHRYYCSECGGKHTDPNTGEWREVFDYKYPYCPLCGAKMNEGVEE